MMNKIHSPKTIDLKTLGLRLVETLFFFFPSYISFPPEIGSKNSYTDNLLFNRSSSVVPGIDQLS